MFASTALIASQCWHAIAVIGSREETFSMRIHGVSQFHGLIIRIPIQRPSIGGISNFQTNPNEQNRSDGSEICSLILSTETNAAWFALAIGSIHRHFPGGIRENKPFGLFIQNTLQTHNVLGKSWICQQKHVCSQTPAARSHQDIYTGWCVHFHWNI